MRPTRAVLAGSVVLAGAAIAATSLARRLLSTRRTLRRADDDMRAVLRKHARLGARPFSKLSPQEARRQPTPADAVAAILEERGQSASTAVGIEKQDLHYPTDGGTQPLRVYKPGAGDGAGARPSAGGEGLPVIVYFHGGGWVIADIDTYESSALALAQKADAIVVSVEYRKGPEHKFPAAHEDAFAAYRWVVQNARAFGGDPARIAVAGESAGGNLAANVAIHARDHGLPMPRHMLLVYPVAGADMSTPSYRENAAARPLDKASMKWFVKHALHPAGTRSPMINLLGADLSGLPSATVITAGIDPLRTEGQRLAQRLEACGSEVTYAHFQGVTHEFFGMDAVVREAAAAQDLGARELRHAFASTSTTGTGTDASASAPTISM